MCLKNEYTATFKINDRKPVTSGVLWWSSIDQDLHQDLDDKIITICCMLQQIQDDVQSRKVIVIPRCKGLTQKGFEKHDCAKNFMISCREKKFSVSE